MPSTIVTRTQSGAESAAGRKTWTFSCWFKKDRGNGSGVNLFGADSNGADTNNYNIIDFNSDSLDFSGYESGSVFRLITNRKFRDTNAWYHLVIAFDTTQATSSNRVKIYINGVQETSFSTENYPAQDYQGKINAQNKNHHFGRSTSSFQWGGVLSHVHLTEGTAYAPTVFGSTDATTGEWKINTTPSVSYGTNGFFLFKDDNSVTNQAGNSSGNFTVSAGTLTKTEDNPSNVFATLNPLCVRNQIAGSANLSYANGNTTHTNTNTSYSSYNVSTLGMQGSGKYYCEFKLNTLGGSSDSERFGISNLNNFSNYPFGSSSGYSYNKDGNATPSGSGFPTYTTNDIIGVAFDAGNGNMWFSKNGTWINSATISEIAAGTTTNAVFTGISTSETWHFSGATYSNGSISANFGNGYFGTTAVASAGTNASNNGIFEYDVPSGYTALSTKGLNT